MKYTRSFNLLMTSLINNRINCDEGFSSNRASYGVVVRSSNGQIIDGVAHVNKCYFFLTVAIWKACQLATGSNFKHAIIESNCKLDVSFSSSQDAPPWQISINLSFAFALRSCNRVAHWIAQQTLMDKLPCNWIVDPPHYFVSFSRTDMQS
ncbi:hypothetical protein POM88_022072 [Heracleum sosnowskyi]|uniref:RNase H type-1 domain-containing protein n=1 Tax=Heracleum sosnowskyi TaxID=360622 RepID=A0AAD8IEC7_9APIA|nr:hypothetical protein POM88_022072 [Heracleum sosnowskyi]